MDKQRSFIIAEAGVNHNGDISIAKKLVDAAVNAGADAVKFQTFIAEKLVTKNAQKAQYQKITTDAGESQFDMLKRLELSKEAHIELIDYCKVKGIIFISTPFDIESASFLHSLGLERIKVSSCDLTNMPFLKHLAGLKKKIILSTGMAGLGEVEQAIRWINEEGWTDIALLHCTTSYPTPFEDVNLKALKTIKSAFNLEAGISDHTPGIEVPIAACALGASIIEKHFTLDKNMEGPDHKASLEPKELTDMVRGIRNIEKALGTGIKSLTPSEELNRTVGRKSITARLPIKKGETITEKHLDIKRPEEGIPPKFFFDIQGKKAQRDISQDEVIKWEDLR